MKFDSVTAHFFLLRMIPLFRGIHDDELQELLHCLGTHEKAYEKDSYIRHEGDPADFIGIVLSGTIQILQDDYNGNRNITSAFGSGHIFGEAFACSGDPYLPVSILAASDCTILFLNIHRVLHPCEHACPFHAKLMLNLIKTLSQKNILLNQKLSYISHKTTAEKLMAYLGDQAKAHGSNSFTIPYDRQALADYLGVERSALSAEIGKLKRQGVLETNRSFFQLKYKSDSNKHCFPDYRL